MSIFQVRFPLFLYVVVLSSLLDHCSRGSSYGNSSPFPPSTGQNGDGKLSARNCHPPSPPPDQSKRLYWRRYPQDTRHLSSGQRRRSSDIRAEMLRLGPNGRFVKLEGSVCYPNSTDCYSQIVVAPQVPVSPPSKSTVPRAKAD